MEKGHKDEDVAHSSLQLSCEALVELEQDLKNDLDALRRRLQLHLVELRTLRDIMQC